MSDHHPTLAEIYGSIVADEAQGQLIAAILQVATEVSQEAVQNGRERLLREETIGCALNPTAYLDGARFARIQQHQAILGALALMIHAMQGAGRR